MTLVHIQAIRESDILRSGCALIWRRKKWNISLTRSKYDMFCRKWDKSFVMRYDNTCHITISDFLLYIRDHLHKKMCIEICSWLIKDEKAWSMYKSSDEVHTFSLSGGERYHLHIDKFSYLEILYKFSIVVCVNSDSSKTLKEINIVPRGKQFEKRTIDQCVSNRSLSWDKNRIIGDCTRLWWHNTSNQ